MSVYNLFLFLHVVGAIGYCASIIILLLGLGVLRSTRRVEPVRAIAGLMSLADHLAVAGGLLILGAGIYMTITTWGWRTGWINTTLFTLVGMVVIALRIIEPRWKAVAKLAKAAADGPLPSPLEAQIHDPILGTALHTLAALVLGIIFLMTVKPSVILSISVIGAALALGLASAVPFWRAARERDGVGLTGEEG